MCSINVATISQSRLSHILTPRGSHYKCLQIERRTYYTYFILSVLLVNKFSKLQFLSMWVFLLLALLPPWSMFSYVICHRHFANYLRVIVEKFLSWCLRNYKVDAWNSRIYGLSLLFRTFFYTFISVLEM